MDRRRLQLFLAVAEEANVFRAASRMNIAQSALSRHIQALEDDLGVTLFERFSTGMRLTNAGQVYRREAQKLLTSYDAAKRLVNEAANGEIGNIVIGANEITLRDPDVLAVIDRFRSQHKTITLQYELHYSQLQMERIWHREIDVGFVYGRPDGSTPLSSYTVKRGGWQLLVPSSHEMLNSGTISVSDLTGQQFIALRQRRSHISYWEPILAQLAKGGVLPQTVLEADTLMDIVALVGAGHGVAFFPDLFASSVTPRVALWPVEGFDFTYELSAVWRADNESSTVGRFVETIRSNSGVAG